MQSPHKKCHSHKKHGNKNCMRFILAKKKAKIQGITGKIAPLAKMQSSAALHLQGLWHFPSLLYPIWVPIVQRPGRAVQVHLARALGQHLQDAKGIYRQMMHAEYPWRMTQTYTHLLPWTKHRPTFQQCRLKTPATQQHPSQPYLERVQDLKSNHLLRQIPPHENSHLSECELLGQKTHNFGVYELILRHYWGCICIFLVWIAALSALHERK